MIRFAFFSVVVFVAAVGLYASSDAGNTLGYVIAWAVLSYLVACALPVMRGHFRWLLALIPNRTRRGDYL